MIVPARIWQFPECAIDGVEQRHDELVIAAHMSSSEAMCPTCGRLSTQVHSHHQRSPQDLPIGEWRVRLHLDVRRFRCLNRTCPRRTFAERMPAFLPTHAQRTQRLTMTLHQVALALGGEAGVRLSSPLHMPTSPATLLRIMRQATVTARLSLHMFSVLMTLPYARGALTAQFSSTLNTAVPLTFCPIEQLLLWCSGYSNIRLLPSLLGIARPNMRVGQRKVPRQPSKLQIAGTYCRTCVRCWSGG